MYGDEEGGGGRGEAEEQRRGRGAEMRGRELVKRRCAE
jgi:hypothetical protein